MAADWRGHWRFSRKLSCHSNLTSPACMRICKAVAPEPAEVDLVLAAAAFVWRVKRRMENRVRTARFRAQVAARDGRLPPPWRMPLRCPGGQLTVTIWVRPGRSRQASGPSAPTPFYVGLTVSCRSGRNPAVPHHRSETKECNRNSSDKVTVLFVKCNKIALQAGMSKFLNSIRSYVRGLTGKMETSSENCGKHQ